jgi:two-component system OmpR family sensor kinase
MKARAVTGDELTLRWATWRISRQIAAAVTVVVFGLVAVAFLVVLHSQHQADDQLLDRAIAEADDVTDPPAGVWLVIRHGAGRIATPGMPGGLPDLGAIDRVAAGGTAMTTDFTAHGREYRVRTQLMGAGEVIQALLDLSADRAERDRLVEACLICGAVGLLVSVVVGAWLGRRAVAPLTEALTLQRRFVADAGHELRTPLTLLSTRAQLVSQDLEAGVDATSMKSDVDGLVADARHLADILDDLLVAADPRETQDVVVVLPALVAQIVESGRPSVEKLGVVLTWTSEDQPPPVRGNRASLRRAVTALLDNAVRHADAAVEVSIRQLGRDVVVDVVDDGPGIAPDVRTTLFDRFTSSKSDEAAGAPSRRYGLGLALVSEVAAQHGGAVSVVDTGRRGATLRLRLPAMRPLASASGRDVRA